MRDRGRLIVGGKRATICGVPKWDRAILGRKIYVFDAYGTLFDVHSAVARHAEKLGPQASRVSEIWRNKQLEYSWVRTLTGRYKDFWTLTAEALDFALAAVPEADPGVRDDLLEAYESLDCYEEVPSVLAGLTKRDAICAIFSNGSPDMLASAVSSAGIGSHLDEVFSIDAIGRYKTVPDSYAIVTKAYGCEASDITFQSSNRWDIAGATAFGFACNWINRTGQPDEYGDLAPGRVLRDLNGLL